MIIRHVREVPETWPTLIGWLTTAWPDYYGAAGPGDARADLAKAHHPDQLPLCLVALDDRAPLGTVSLRPHSIASHRHLSPWLTTLLVAPEHRRRGIGAALVAAIEAEARRLQIPRIYTATDEAASLIERRRWQIIDIAGTERGAMNVYACDAETSDRQRRRD